MILVKNNHLYDFIQQLLITIKENAPEFINLRNVHFSKKQVDNGIFTNVFEKNGSIIYNQKCNGLINPSKEKSDGFLLHLSKDCIKNKLYGSIFHYDESFYLSGFYPYPWLKENKDKNITDEMIIKYANLIAPNYVRFKHSITRLVFTTNQSILKQKDCFELTENESLNDTLYFYAHCYIKEDKLIKSLESDFITAVKLSNKLKELKKFLIAHYGILEMHVFALMLKMITIKINWKKLKKF